MALLKLLSARVCRLAVIWEGQYVRKVIDRLKKLAPKAEKYGLTIGLETWLNKEEHMYILDSVGSNSVKVYYDTANMLRKGYDIYNEISKERGNVGISSFCVILE